LTWGNAIQRKIILLPFCVVLFAGSRSACAQPAPSVSHVQLSPLKNGVELADGSSLLDVEILENRLISAHVRPDGNATPRTLVIDPHPALHPPTAVTRSNRDGVYTLSALGISVRIKERSPYTITFLDGTGRQLLRSVDPFAEARDSGVTMQHAADDTLYGIHGLGITDTAMSLTRNGGGEVVAGFQGNSGAPFVFSVRYGLLVDSDGGEFSTSPRSFAFRHSSRPDVEYLVFAGPPLETMAALSRVVGPPPLPPEWTLGFLNSQWGSTQDEVESIVAEYRKRDLPIDGFILDFDWKAWGEDNYGEWRWNSTSGPGNVSPDKFPGGASGDFSKAMAAQGIKLSGILKPRILTAVDGDPNQPTQAAAYATEHHFWYPGEAPFKDYFSHRMARDLDFNNPDERAWFWQHLLPAFQSGLVGWWNDEADASEDFTLRFNNFQFMNMGRAVYEGQRANSNLRVWSINRNFYLGASRYGYALWSGDIRTGFDSMAFQAQRMLAALDTGESHWSMDTGGFIGHPNAENYARWMEFAAFVPIMRVHGTYLEKRQPWVYGPMAEAAAKNALDLRYQLLPYIYSYERLNTEGEVGLVRPLFWEFPSDPGAAGQNSEWMFGDALLVAPVLTQGATSQTIYLPAGEWFDYASGQSYHGAQGVQVAIDATTWKDIPLFVRSGSILATQPVEQYVSQRPTPEITLDVFPSQTLGAFTAYDDDGQTYDYEKGICLRQEITARRIGKEVRVKIDAAIGSYAGPLQTYLIRIHAAGEHVTLNGKPLPAAGNASPSSAPGENWARQNDRFGPLALLRIAAGAKTAALITLR